jgi:hypothetical protein
VDYGGSETFDFTPDPGYHVADVLVDAISQGAIPSYTFNNVIADHTISVTFALTEAIPIITSAPVTAAIMAESYAYDVNASGIPIPTYRLLVNPSGMTIDSIIGMIQWLPAHTGNYAVSVQAKNSVGSDTQEYVITVTGCDYIPGDINGDGERIGGDVTYGVRFFKGIGNPPPDSCYMDSTSAYLYVAGDCNGNCEFRGSDITRLVAYFKSTAQLATCHFFPVSPVLREKRQVPIHNQKD